jgi:hypothetical protein
VEVKEASFLGRNPIRGVNRAIPTLSLYRGDTQITCTLNDSRKLPVE